MSATPDITVLVPACNAQRTIGQCLESLRVQDVPTAEFICLDDGSADETAQIMRRFAERDSRFTVVSKPNTGYGHTMNAGISMATGTYVGILESDDWLAPGALETLIALAFDEGAPDIVKANHYTFDDAGGERFFENYGQSLCDRLIELPGPDYPGLILSVPAIWAAIYRRDFLEENAIRFLETPGASFQDTGFVFKSWVAARRVYVIHRGFLHYRSGNAGSSTVSAEKVDCVLDEWRSIDEFVARRDDEGDLLAKVLATKKFQTFYWNLRRIDPAYAKGFIESARNELEREIELGHIEEALFTPGEWSKLAQWMARPDSLALDVAIAHEGDALARLALRARRKAMRLLAQGTRG